ncbi:MAG: 30S ribosomal protein S17 [bacterium]
MQKEKIGYVISNKMNKTIIVESVKLVSHPLYKKVIKKKNKFYAHDENLRAKIGDKVKIKETRPLSKMKKWRLVEIMGEEK